MTVEYKLTAYVDDTVVYESRYEDTVMLEEDLGKAEAMVELELAKDE